MKVVKIRLFIIVCILLFSNLYARAQFGDITGNGDKLKNIPRNMPLTPQVSEMLRYDQMPVSSYTGVPGISIPLYNINVKGLSLPLTLNYHAGGIAVNQLSGEFGMGWSLNLPTIVQLVKGKDDLDRKYTTLKPDFMVYPTYHISDNTRHFSSPSPYAEGIPIFDITPLSIVKPNTYVKNYHRFSAFNKNVYKYAFYARFIEGWLPLNGSYRGYTSSSYTYHQNHHNSDGEYDIFRVTMPDESFSFIVDRLGNKDEINQIIVLDSKKYKVDYEYEGPNKTNNTIGNLKKVKWIVTSNKGVVYRFDECEVSKTSSNTNHLDPNEGDDLFINKPMSSYSASGEVSQRRWPVTRIYDQTDAFIFFKYTKFENIPSLPTITDWRDYYRFDKVQKLNPNNHIGPPYLLASTSGLLTDCIEAKRSISFTGSNRLILNRINFRQGVVDFTIDNKIYTQYSKIKIKDFNDQLVDQITFSYFNTRSNDKPEMEAKFFGIDCRKRTFLKNISFKNSGKYFFEYNNTKLPNLLSFATDYWGYYNGELKNKSTIIPKLNEPIEGFPNTGSVKTAKEKFCMAGILTKVIYPTGGSTIYEYELNSFSEQYDGSTRGCGLRVKKISNFINSKMNFKKIYHYYDGILKHPLVFRSGVLGAQCRLSEFLIKGYTTRRMYSGHYVSSGSYYGSSILGYSKVIEKQYGANNGYLGKVEYLYKNKAPVDTYSLYKSNILYPAPTYLDTDESLESGFLYTKNIYGADDKIRKCVSRYREKFSYFKGYLYNVKWGMNHIYYGVGPSSTGNSAEGTEFLHSANIVMFSLLPIPCTYSSVGERTTVYDENGSGFEQTNSSRCNYIKHDGSNYFLNKHEYLGYRKNEYNYRQKKYIYPLSKKDRVSKFMIKKNMVDFPLEVVEEQYVRPVWSSSILKTELQKNRYSYDKFGELICLSKIFVNDKLDMQFTKYDRYGNLIEYRDANGCFYSQIWGYVDQGGMPHYRLAVIQGVKYSDITKEAFDKIKELEDFKFLLDKRDGEMLFRFNTLNSEIREFFVNGRVTTFTHRPLIGLETVTDPNMQLKIFFYKDGKLSTVRGRNGEILQSCNYNIKYMEDVDLKK